MLLAMMEHSQVAGGQLDGEGGRGLLKDDQVGQIIFTMMHLIGTPYFSSLLVQKEGDTACSKRLTLALDCHQTSK